MIEMLFGGASGCNSGGEIEPPLPSLLTSQKRLPSSGTSPIAQPDVAQRNPSLADSRLVFIEQIKKKRGVGNSLVPAIFRTGVNDVVMQIANRTEFLKLAKTEAQNGRTRCGPDYNLCTRFLGTKG